MVINNYNILSNISNNIYINISKNVLQNNPDKKLSSNIDYSLLSLENINDYLRKLGYILFDKSKNIIYMHNCEWHTLYKSFNLLDLRKNYIECPQEFSLSLFIKDRLNSTYSAVYTIKKCIIKLYNNRNEYKKFFSLSLNSTNSQKITDAHYSICYLFIILYQIFVKEPNDSIIHSLLLIVEREILSKIYVIIFPVFIEKFKKKDIILIGKKNLYKNKPISEIPFLEIDCKLKDKINYKIYADNIKDISDYYSPIDKLNCIKMVYKMICYDLSEFLNVRNIGADILLPIFCYIIIIADIKNLFAETLYIKEFAHETFIDGEDGYALANLETAINIIYELN